MENKDRFHFDNRTQNIVMVISQNTLLTEYLPNARECCVRLLNLSVFFLNLREETPDNRLAVFKFIIKNTQSGLMMPLRSTSQGTREFERTKYRARNDAKQVTLIEKQLSRLFVSSEVYTFFHLQFSRNSNAFLCNVRERCYIEQIPFFLAESNTNELYRALRAVFLSYAGLQNKPVSHETEFCFLSFSNHNRNGQTATQPV